MLSCVFHNFTKFKTITKQLQNENLQHSIYFIYSYYSMKIYIINTFCGKSMTHDVEPNDTIFIIKLKIQNKQSIQVYHQRLIFQNKRLENEKTLSDYGIQNESIIYLIIP